MYRLLPAAEAEARDLVPPGARRGRRVGRLDGLERFYSNLVHLPLKRLPRYPGSGTSWVDHHFPGSTSFVVELPPRVKPKTSFLNADAVERLAASLG